MTGTAVTVTAPACHTRPEASFAVASWPALGAVVIDVTVTLSWLLSVSDSLFDATMVPPVVTALALMVQTPFWNATAPVAGLKAAVLKLNVTGDEASLAATGARSPLETVWVWTVVSLPLQLMIKLTVEIFWEPASTLTVTSI